MKVSTTLVRCPPTFSPVVSGATRLGLSCAHTQGSKYKGSSSMPNLPPKKSHPKALEPDPPSPSLEGTTVRYVRSKTEASLRRVLDDEAGRIADVAALRIAAQELPALPKEVAGGAARSPSSRRRHRKNNKRRPKKHVSPSQPEEAGEAGLLLSPPHPSDSESAPSANSTPRRNSGSAAPTSELPGTTKRERRRVVRSQSRSNRRPDATSVPALPKDTRWEDFHVLETIGRGEYGFVVVARHIFSGQLYAVKILSKRQALKQGSMTKLIREVEVHRHVSGHPHVISMAGACQDSDNVYVAMEFCCGADLFGLIAREERIPPDDARVYLSQLVLGVEHLHGRGVVYRDLKPENVLIDGRGMLKLADFGLSKRLRSSERTATHCGTLEYLAPEVITKSGHGRAVDLWALGILLHEMVLGHGPFDTKTRRRPSQEVHREILATQKVPVALIAPVFRTEPGLARLLHGLLAFEPAKRLGAAEAGGFAELKRSTWLRAVQWEALARGDATPPVAFVPSASAAAVAALATEAPCPGDDAKAPMAAAATAGAGVAGLVDTSLFDAATEAAQEHREQAAFECWLPRLGPEEKALFEDLC
jgi:hypothetical protein